MDDKILPITMPKWGLTMKEGTVVTWLKNVGDYITKGDNIVEIETEKVLNEFECPMSGILLKKIVEQNTKLSVGSLIAVLGKENLEESIIDKFVEEFHTNFLNQQTFEEKENDLNKIIIINNIEINYLNIGDTNHKNLLFIHGFGGDLKNWMFNQEELSKNFNTYAIDLPGHGMSNKQITEGSITFLASIVSNFCKELQLTNLTVAGHSLGAGIAICAAQTIPDLVKKLVLISPIGFNKEINTTYLENFITVDSRKDLKKILESLYFNSSIITRDLVNEVLKIKRIDGCSEVLSLIKNEIVYQDKQKNNFIEDIKKLDIPRSIILGSQDKIIPYIDKEKIKKINYFILDNCGHMAHIEKSNEVNKIILDD